MAAASTQLVNYLAHIEDLWFARRISGKESHALKVLAIMTERGEPEPKIAHLAERADVGTKIAKRVIREAAAWGLKYTIDHSPEQRAPFPPAPFVDFSTSRCVDVLLWEHEDETVDNAQCEGSVCVASHDYRNHDTRPRGPVQKISSETSISAAAPVASGRQSPV